MRSLVLLSAALFASAAMAQKTTPKLQVHPNDRTGQEIDLKNIEIKGDLGLPGSVRVDIEGSQADVVALSLDRSFVDCIPGNLDREDLERVNGEIR